VQKIAYSLKKQLAAPRKIYLVDSSFHQVCGLTFTPNKGRNIENTAFIELKRKGKEVYYYSDDNECDFVIKKGTTITEAIQVCYSLDTTNREREINGLLDAMNAFKLQEGTILTFEQTEELTIKGKKIKILPVPKWALEENK